MPLFEKVSGNLPEQSPEMTTALYPIDSHMVNPYPTKFATFRR